MILGSHVIISAYGFWLPNDPRGSWSDMVRAWELRRFGPATKVETTQSVAARPHDRKSRKAAKESLRYPPVSFDGLQARAIACGFANFVKRSGVEIWACAILPEHVHLVIARHTYEVEQIVNLLKGDATRQLKEEDIHPHKAFKRSNGRVHGCWSRHEWKVFLDSEADIVRAIRYVEGNPEKERKKPQRWNFVKTFSGEPQATEVPEIVAGSVAYGSPLNNM
jgi:REP element-mobilizing transposase RayT